MNTHKLFTTIFFLAFTSTFFIVPVSAADFQSSTGNTYIAENQVNVSRSVEGDFIGAGGEVILNQPVDDNVIVGGRTVLINEDIKGDVFVAGGYVVVNGNILGDVRIFASEVYINSDVIRGDFVAAGSELYISENTQIFGEQSLQFRTIERNTSDNPTDLSKGGEFSIFGDLNSGVSAFSSGLASTVSAIGIIISLIMFLGGIIVSYFILKLFPVFTESTLETMKSQPIKSTGIGALMILLIPFLTGILLLSVVGLKLFIFLVFLFGIAYFIAQAYIRYLVGRIIFKKLGQSNTGRLIPLIAGSIVISLLFLLISFIPVVGGLLIAIVNFGVLAVVLGAIMLNKLRALP